MDVDDDVDEVDGYDMPMSIYSQLFITFKLNCFDQSFQVSFKISKRLSKVLNSDLRSFYFIQSAYTIYLCMSMAIYFYLLLEVVMLIRKTILNRFNRIRNVSITLEDWNFVLQRKAVRWERWGGVQAHVRVLRRVLEVREQWSGWGQSELNESGFLTN